MSRKGKNVIYFAIIILTSLVVGAYFVITPKIEADNQATININNQDSFSNIKNWKIYRNEEYGFEIQYPPDRKVSLRADNIISIPYLDWHSYKGGEVDVSIEIRKVSLEEFIQEFNTSDVLDDGTILSEIVGQRNYVLDGFSAHILTASQAIGGTVNFIFAEKGDHSYIITFLENNKLHQDIISTFKFIDEQKVEDSLTDWKRYQNRELGFKFNYPAEWPCYRWQDMQAGSCTDTFDWKFPQKSTPAPFLKEGDFHGNGRFPGDINSVWKLYLGTVNKGACGGSNCYDFEFDGFPANTSREAIIKRLTNYPLISIQSDSTVNNVRTIIYTEGGICGYKNALMIASDNIVRLTARCGADNAGLSNLFDQVLATFKFVKKEKAEEFSLNDNQYRLTINVQSWTKSTPIEGVLIEVQDKSSKEIISAKKTNKNGIVEFMLKIGNYNYKVKQPSSFKGGGDVELTKDVTKELKLLAVPL